MDDQDYRIAIDYDQNELKPIVPDRDVIPGNFGSIAINSFDNT